MNWIVWVAIVLLALWCAGLTLRLSPPSRWYRLRRASLRGRRTLYRWLDDDMRREVVAEGLNQPTPRPDAAPARADRIESDPSHRDKLPDGAEAEREERRQLEWALGEERKRLHATREELEEVRTAEGELRAAIETHHQRVAEILQGGRPFAGDDDQFSQADQELYRRFNELSKEPLPELPESEDEPELPPLPPESIPGAAAREPEPPLPPAQPVEFTPPPDPAAGAPQPVPPPSPQPRTGVQLPPRPDGIDAGPGALARQMAAVNNVNPDQIPEDPLMGEPPPQPGASRPPRRIERKQQTEQRRERPQRQRRTTPAGISEELLAGLPADKRAELETFLADQ